MFNGKGNSAKKPLHNAFEGVVRVGNVLHAHLQLTKPVMRHDGDEHGRVTHEVYRSTELKRLIEEYRAEGVDVSIYEHAKTVLDAERAADTARVLAARQQEGPKASAKPARTPYKRDPNYKPRKSRYII